MASGLPSSSDRELLRYFVQQNDGEAFAVLVDRYANMVYTTSWRIVGDESQAADTVQETFFQLVKSADKVTGSIGAWLHRVATRRAIDLIRQNAARRNRERNYALDASLVGNSWSEIEPAVDETLDELPDASRELLLLHFLQGRSTIQIAAEQGLSQPTISRRLTVALEMLRDKLRERGILAGVVPLQALLLHSNQILPETVRQGLGKIALAKAASSRSFWLFGHSGSKMGGKLTITAAGVALLVGTVWILKNAASGLDSSTAAPPTFTQTNSEAANLQPSAEEPSQTDRIATTQASHFDQVALADPPATPTRPMRPPTIEPIVQTNLPPDTPLANPRHSLPAQASPTVPMEPGRNGSVPLVAEQPWQARTPGQVNPTFYNRARERDLLMKGDIYKPRDAFLAKDLSKTNPPPRGLPGRNLDLGRNRVSPFGPAGSRRAAGNNGL